jgi:raffinose/stachyose/melibiose transport system permease protein
VSRPSKPQLNVALSRRALGIPLIAWALITLYPFAWTVVLSLRTLGDLYAHPFALPNHLHFENYVQGWKLAHVRVLAVNSLFVAALSTILVLAFSAPASYALSRHKFPGRPIIWIYLMLGLFAPDVARLVPLAILTRWFHLYDSRAGLAIVYTALGIPFCTFLISSFMSALPKELEQAAVVDGAGMWRIFRDVILPLSRPALVTAATFHALYCWNEFILASIILESNRNLTLPIGMNLALGEYSTNLPQFAAAVVMSLIPSIVTFVLLQRYVVRGLTAGALRG